MSPSTYQSGKLYSFNAKMEKRDSKYLRSALFTTFVCVCRIKPSFILSLTKKRVEDKHCYIAISHIVKKLVRLIFHLEKIGKHCIALT